VKLLDNAVDCLVATDEVKKGFLGLSADAVRLYKAVLPDSKADQFRPICRLLGILADKIRALRDSVDISGVMEQVSALLDRSIAPEEYLIPQPTPDKRVDLSSIDFEALAKKFQAGHRHSEAERLRSAIAAKLTRMVRLNRSRMDFLAKFQKMIDEYNAGSVNVEEHFRRLTAFARGLNEEDQRAIGEQLSEEELAVFDLLTKPEMKLSAKDQRKVKQTARELLETLKREKLVLDWRKRQQARADVRVTIEKMLDAGLPEAYSRALFAAKSEALFQHVYECYFGAGRSVYSAAA
jgi:type I restriction enzyme R subunit